VTFTLRLEPGGATISAAPGTPLRELLFPYGVEFPCGGEGTCGNCRVQLTDGRIILACQEQLSSDLAVRIGGWEHSILTEHAGQVTRGVGRGIAIDLGTTTVVAQLIDGETGSVLGVRAELNSQAAYGADVMTRIGHALTPEGRANLRDTIRKQVHRMAGELTAEPVPVVITGNTAMHHLFGGIDVEPLSRAPFDPVNIAPLREPNLTFVQPIGGFVGSDILAGIVATGMDQSTELSVLLDLGTNGEIVAGTRDRLLCASTAAGPAFEGGRISCGMRASTGAIATATAVNGAIQTRVLGDTTARGICGSGLVDIVAAALNLRLISPNGRIETPTRTLQLQDGLQLLQSDIRELQLAKGAIAAGLSILLSRLHASPSDIRHLYLAGAFGNYVRQSSAHRIGLLPFNDTRIQPAGNASLAGAKLILFMNPDLPALLRRVEHIPLHADPAFQDAYIDHMRF